MQAGLFREMRCELGEGALWDGTHLWFFDITGCMLYRLDPEGKTLESWEGGQMASAAARTSTGALLIATETGLMLFDPDTHAGDTLCPLEADNPATRSNDGRADRQGGFWIGTMGKQGEHEAGALYRWYRGALRCLRRGLTTPNAICFSPDGRCAYFADTRLATIYRWLLGPEGWPIGAPEVFHVVDDPTARPDGAVTDESGALWVALWGGSRVIRIGTNGLAREQVTLPVSRPTCPALTPDGRLFVTSARQGLDAGTLETEPLAGSIFTARLPIGALPEPEVIL
ncbi:SMP-30/gluconolactonase/LRE family protein [Halovulum dunhuangense]|uniref:SMP-30/gluconolactonase/LRE family protein n=1 Tax=Halovulum dunhuangense TaxID=1505036 RepID=A0A849L0S4_9RHOB|nr:SMP-30/gluconolactonase/LRE family protein [Halovulum dunhuangense]